METESDCTKVGRSGRGPTRLMSPSITFHNWGISSRRARRRNFPTRVTRESWAEAQTGPGALRVCDHAPELVDLEWASIGVRLASLRGGLASVPVAPTASTVDADTDL